MSTIAQSKLTRADTSSACSSVPIGPTTCAPAASNSIPISEAIRYSSSTTRNCLSASSCLATCFITRRPGSDEGAARTQRRRKMCKRVQQDERMRSVSVPSSTGTINASNNMCHSDGSADRCKSAGRREFESTFLVSMRCPRSSKSMKVGTKSAMPVRGAVSLTRTALQTMHFRLWVRRPSSPESATRPRQLSGAPCRSVGRRDDVRD
jgi:hypothetical protein